MDTRDFSLALFTPISTERREVAVFAYLDPEWRLLGMRHIYSSLADGVEVPMRNVVADALAFDAVAVAMAHNHPSGDPTPSTTDHIVTRRLARALDPLGVRLVEHVVLAPGGGCMSFRAHGLL